MQVRKDDMTEKSKLEVNNLILQASIYMPDDKPILQIIKNFLMDKKNFDLFKENRYLRFCAKESCVQVWHNKTMCSKCNKSGWVLTTEGKSFSQSTFQRKRKEIESKTDSPETATNLNQNNKRQATDSNNINTSPLSTSTTSTTESKEGETPLAELNRFAKKLFENISEEDIAQIPYIMEVLKKKVNFDHFQSMGRLNFCNNCNTINLKNTVDCSCGTRFRVLANSGASLSHRHFSVVIKNTKSTDIHPKKNAASLLPGLILPEEYETKKEKILSDDTILNEERLKVIANLEKNISATDRPKLNSIVNLLKNDLFFKIFYNQKKLFVCTNSCCDFLSFSSHKTCPKCAGLYSAILISGKSVCYLAHINNVNLEKSSNNGAQATQQSPSADQNKRKSAQPHVIAETEENNSKRQKVNDGENNALTATNSPLNPAIQIKEESDTELVPIELDPIITTFKDIMITKLGNMPEDNCGHIAKYVIASLKALITGENIPEETITTTASDLSTTDKSIAVHPVKIKTEKGVATKKTQPRILNSFVHQTQAGLHQHLPSIQVEDVDQAQNNTKRQFVDLEPSMLAQMRIKVDSLSSKLMKMAAEQNKILIVQVDLYRTDPNKAAHVVIACASKDKIYYIDGGQFRHMGKFVFTDLQDLYSFSRPIVGQTKGEFYDDCFCLVRETLSTTKVKRKEKPQHTTINNNNRQTSVTNVTLFKPEAVNVKQFAIRKILRDLTLLNLSDPVSLPVQLAKFTKQLNDYFLETNLKTQLQQILFDALSFNIKEMQLLIEKIKLINTSLVNMNLSNEPGWRLFCIVCVSKHQQLMKNQPKV